ncbi:MAG: hypothetical protein L3K16_03610 [Thermoplasmata archaeon]|nr:hypothetical protein [Thermoplasmata archaeon]
MATYAAASRSSGPAPIAALRDRIQATLDQEPYRPWCVHGLYEELTDPDGLGDRETLLMRTQLAADELAANGVLYRESISAVTIGVHCQDTLYWTKRAGIAQLEEFGPEYESPAILHRLGAHFLCHGL